MELRDAGTETKVNGMIHAEVGQWLSLTRLTPVPWTRHRTRRLLSPSPHIPDQVRGRALPSGVTGTGARTEIETEPLPAFGNVVMCLCGSKPVGDGYH